MRIIEKSLRWITIIGIFVLPFVPLIVTTSMFFPYITGKNFAFRIIVEVIACAWLALALIDARYRPKRDWILGCFAVFILVIAVADALGANPLKSFWSNYERMDGWVTIAHLFLYLVVASVMMNSEKLWHFLFQGTLAISACLSIYGLWQVAGSAGLATRIDATFGNPIYLAIYMLFNVFIAVLLIVQEGKKKWGTFEKYALPVVLFLGFACIAPQATSLSLLFLIGIVSILILQALMFVERRYMYAFIIVLDTIALFLTGTRGTELGLIGGGLLAIILYAFLAGTKRMRMIALSCVIVVAVLAAGLRLEHNAPWVQNVGFLERLASISLSDDTVYARLLNIQIATKGVEERPILGWGQENYAIVFDKYYDPRMYAQESWFDRVHNIIFDWLVAGGVLGLAAYLSIFAATLWVLWKKTKAGTHAFTVAERSVITGLLAGYFIHNLSVFDNITSYILFGTVLGYIVWRKSTAGDARPLFKGELLSKSLLPFTAIGMTLVAIGLVWAVNGNAYAENTTLLSALEPQGNPATNLALFEKAISYGTYGNQEAREQLVQTAAEVASAPASSVSNDLKQQFFNESVNQMMLQEKQSPLDARFPLFVGTVEDSYGDYADASTSLELAHELSPDKQSILFQIGSNDSALGNAAAALAAFKQAYELDTVDQQAQIYYAAAAIRAGDDATVGQLLTPALIASGAAADPQVAAAFAARNQYAKIIPIWAAALAANPTNPSDYTTLAAAYYETGNSGAAIATLQALIKAVPSDADQANSFIQQVQSGKIQVQ